MKTKEGSGLELLAETVSLHPQARMACLPSPPNGICLNNLLSSQYLTRIRRTLPSCASRSIGSLGYFGEWIRREHECSKSGRI